MIVRVRSGVAMPICANRTGKISSQGLLLFFAMLDRAALLGETCFLLIGFDYFGTVRQALLKNLGQDFRVAVLAKHQLGMTRRVIRGGRVNAEFDGLAV